MSKEFKQTQEARRREFAELKECIEALYSEVSSKNVVWQTLYRAGQTRLTRLAFMYLYKELLPLEKQEPSIKDHFNFHKREIVKLLNNGATITRVYRLMKQKYNVPGTLSTYYSFINEIWREIDRPGEIKKKKK
jgi:hypothetical protein